MYLDNFKLLEKTEEQVLREQMEEDKIFFCDYITFQFELIEERGVFITLLNTILKQNIVVHDVALTGLDRYSIPKLEGSEILALSDHDLKKRKIHYLSFFGKHSVKIYNILFHQKILNFANKIPYKEKRIELKRIDYKTFLNVQEECSNSSVLKVQSLNLLKKKELNPENFEAPYLFLVFELVKLTAELMNLKNPKDKRRQNFETSKTGWTLDLGNNKKTWKTRIYYRIPPINALEFKERISLEVQLTKSLTNKLTSFWKKKDFNQFVEKSLRHYLVAMDDVQKSTIIELYNIFILPRLYTYLSYFKKEKLLNNSIINPINCVITQDFKQQNFCLENTNEFVSFVALYRQIIIYAKEKLWNLEEYNTIPFMDKKNIQTFKFMLPDLLFLVGWEKTPHYNLKMKQNLLALQSFAIYSSNFRFGKAHGFHSLITNLTITNKEIMVSVNMRVLVTLIQPISEVDLSIFSFALPTYYEDFKEYYKKEKITKKTYPSYFYSVIAQSLSSLENNISYTGDFPKNGNAIKHFNIFTIWLFKVLLPKFTKQKIEILQIEKYSQLISIRTTNGSFTYPNFAEIK